MKPTEATIEKLVKKWRSRLGIDERWTIELRLYRDKKIWPKSQKGNAAFVRTQSGYFQASISFNLEALANDNVEHVVVHELVHIVLDVMSTIVRDAMGDDHDATYRIIMEQTTETITRALMKGK